MQTEPHPGVAAFRYATTCRVIFLIGAIFCGTFTFIVLRASPEKGGGFAWPAIGIFLFGLLHALLLWASLPTFETDSEGITRSCLGKRRRLLWREVTLVEHRPTSSSLLLCTGTRRLRIHRQIRGFLPLFEIISNSVPPGAVELPFTIPFEVDTSWNLRLVFGGMSGLFLVLGVYAFMGNAEWESAALLIGLGVGNLVLLATQALLRFEFDASGLRVVYPVRTIRYSAAELRDVSIVQRELDIVVALQFGARTVELSDNQIVVAPERVYESLIQAYHLREDRSDQTDCSPGKGPLDPSVLQRRTHSAPDSGSRPFRSL